MILFIHQGALGDVVCAFPALGGLKKRWGRVDALCRGALGKLAVELGVADNGFSFDAACFASLFAGSVSDRAKQFLARYRHILLFSFSEDVRRTIEHAVQVKTTRVDPRPGPGRRMRVPAYLVSELTVRGLLDPPNELPASQRKTGDFDSETVIIHPGSGSGKKNWPVDRFAEVFTGLKHAGQSPVFLLGPAEDFLEKEIGGPAHRVSDLFELVALLGKTGGFIGNDSGVTHLAAYLGLPVVAIFGPSDPERWRPFGKHVKIVRPELNCEPCFETGKDLCADRQCIDRTEPPAVLGAYFDLRQECRTR